MHLLYKSASLLTYTYYYRQSYSRADYEDSYALALSAALSGGSPSGYGIQRLRRAPRYPPLLTALGDQWTQVRPRPWESSSSASMAFAITPQCLPPTAPYDFSYQMLPVW